MSTEKIDVHNVIGKIVLVNLQIGTFHGTSRTPFEGMAGADELYTPGSLRLLDPKKLRWAPTTKAQAHRACLDVGTRFLGGYAIPEDRFRTLQEEIKKASESYQAGRSKFLAELDQSVTDWADAHEDRKAEILAKRPDQQYVGRQLRFSVAAFRVSPSALADGLHDGIESEVGSLVWNIACEVAQDVKVTWQPIDGRVTQRIRSGLLKRIASKTDGLSFVSPKIGRITTLIRQIDDSMPKEGHIEGRDFLILEGLMSILGDPRKLLADNPLVVSIPEDRIEEHVPVVVVHPFQSSLSSMAVDSSDVVSALPEAPPVPRATPQSSAYGW